MYTPFSIGEDVNTFDSILPVGIYLTQLHADTLLGRIVGAPDGDNIAPIMNNVQHKISSAPTLANLTKAVRRLF